MNKRLHVLNGENAAVKVGNRWSLSPFMRENWGAKVDEMQKVEEPDDFN